MFIWNNDDLNPEQVNAIKYDGSVMLIACPGSGKTRTLTYKIALELSKLENRRNFIIAITYTNRAADEIKERVEILGVDTEQLWIGTIHSFCAEWILRPYSLYIPELKNGFRIINSFDSEELITQICDDFNKKRGLRGRDRITYWDCGFTASPAGLKITTSNKGKYRSVETILQKYWSILKSQSQIDFEHILQYSYYLLQKHPAISQILGQLFPNILIDEYQDTKEIQYEIIALILKGSLGSTRLFIVGDPNQAIYQTLGGYPIEKSTLEEVSDIELKKLELQKNYRSSSKIIEYFDYFKTIDNEIEPCWEKRITTVKLL